MKVNFLSNSVSWFGKYSGYERMPNYFPPGYQINQTPYNRSLLTKALGKGICMLYSPRFVGMHGPGVWRTFNFMLKTKSYDVSHLLYSDGYLRFLKAYPHQKRNLFGTLHFPVSNWASENLERLDYLPNGIILYKEELDVFNRYRSKPLKFIRHGVDTDFFAPGQAQQVNPKKLLFVGSFLRNFDMFFEVYNMINKEIADDYEFHLIIPQKNRSHPLMQNAPKNIFFHENLTDEELLWQYQTSYLLLMPMQDSGANTAVIQAIATGLPVITTDVGGIRSYGGGDIYPVVANNDSLGMVELLNRYRNNPDYREQVAANQREFALTHLEWHKIANEHIAHYQQVTGINN